MSDLIGYIVELPNKELGLVLFTYQRMVRQGRTIKWRVIHLVESGMKEQTDSDNKPIIKVHPINDIKVLGGAYNGPVDS